LGGMLWYDLPSPSADAWRNRRERACCWVGCKKIEEDERLIAKGHRLHKQKSVTKMKVTCNLKSIQFRAKKLEYMDNAIYCIIRRNTPMHCSNS
jgi:hypothetical protein